MKTLFPNAVESELFGARLNYKVPKGDVGKLSEIFKRLEQGRSDCIELILIFNYFSE